jgi:hypothetical protein
MPLIRILLQPESWLPTLYLLLHHPSHPEQASKGTELSSCLEEELQRSQADAGTNQMLQGNVEEPKGVVMCLNGFHLHLVRNCQQEWNLRSPTKK